MNYILLFALAILLIYILSTNKTKEGYISLLSTIRGFPCERDGRCCHTPYMDYMYDWDSDSNMYGWDWDRETYNRPKE